MDRENAKGRSNPFSSVNANFKNSFRFPAPLYKRYSVRSDELYLLEGSLMLQFMEHFKRFKSTRINEIKLCPREIKRLDHKIQNGLAPRAAKYICWRHSMLSFAFLPFALSTSLKLSNLWHNSNWETFSSQLKAYIPFLKPSHAHFFQILYAMWVGQNVLYAVSMGLTVIMMIQGIRTWPSYEQSKRRIRFGYGISFALPFIVLLFMPFRQSVDFSALKKVICLDNLDATLNSPLLPPLNVTGDEICHKPPSLWIPTLKTAISDAGIKLNASTHTCDKAVRAYNTFQLNNQSMQSLQQLDGHCSNSTCSYCFAERKHCVSIAAGILYGGLSQHECAPCYAPQPALQELSCMDVCKNHYMPQLMSETNGFCVSEVMMLQLDGLGNVVQQFDYIEYFVGAFIGATALQTLFPASFSLMVGSIRGARVSKCIAPWSRLPGYGIGATIILGMPMLAAMMISVNQVIGDAWSLFAILFMFISIVVWLPVGDLSHGVADNDNQGLLEPQSSDVASNELLARNRISLFSKLMAVAFLLLFLAKSELGKLFQLDVENYVVQRLGETMMSFVLDLMGKSLLSAVVFSDLCVDVFTHVTSGDFQDSEMVKNTRNTICRHISTLIHPTNDFDKIKGTKLAGLAAKSRLGNSRINST